MARSWLQKLCGFHSSPTRHKYARRVWLDVEECEPRITPQATRTWVSGVGDDANPASRTAPAKTFAGALAHTAAGGEISVLDSGGFGSVTITKSLTIDGSGFLAGVLASATNGIIINAAATDVITLRGLYINGTSQGLSSGVGLNGIRILQAGVVNIEDSVIENFSQLGIDFKPANAGARLFVKNTTIRNCVQGGVLLKPAAGISASASIDHVYSQLNAYGFRAEDRTNVSITNSVASGNTGHGFVASSTSANVRMTLARDVAANNGNNGVACANPNAKVKISNLSAFENSGAGTKSYGGGTIFSFGNNRLSNNDRGFTPITITTGGSTASGALRTWVSGVGDDADPASRTAPARTFAGAISKTTRGGEIDVLDPGGFGGVTITKAIVIDGSGSFGSILAAGTNGVIVNAGVNDVVVLRGLKINGVGTGLNGIKVIQAAAVFVENCTISNFTGQGIDFEPTNAGAQLFVTNTTITNSAGAGVLIKPNGVAARAALDHVMAEYNGNGFRIEDRANVMISNSTANGNKANGFLVLATSNSAVLNLDNCDASNNTSNGVKAQGSASAVAKATVSKLLATDNGGKGLLAVLTSPAHSFINSFGNLWVEDNVGGNGSPTGSLSES